MNTTFDLWRKLAKSKKFREAFVSSQLKRVIPFQIGVIMRKRGMSQAALAEASGLTQGVISRAANPDYGNLTFNTVLKIANGFDMAFVGKFVPFSELTKWLENLSEESLEVPSFEEEDKKLREGEPIGSMQGSISDSLADKASGKDRNMPLDFSGIYTATKSTSNKMEAVLS